MLSGEDHGQWSKAREFKKKSGIHQITERPVVCYYKKKEFIFQLHQLYWNAF